MSLVYLKVKIKSLAAEASIIRREEQRFVRGFQDDPIYQGLRSHRTYDVRREARAAQLAYAFLRDRSYHAVEFNATEPPNWFRVGELVLKYGTERTTKPEMVKRLEAWSVADRRMAIAA